MYMGSVWENVNSIYRSYRCINVPNLCNTSFRLMYIDVYKLTIITQRLRFNPITLGVNMRPFLSVMWA
jgi:hypothetical protein